MQRSHPLAGKRDDGARASLQAVTMPMPTMGLEERHPRVPEWKEQLRRVTDEATARAIERTWHPSHAVEKVSQLQGRWRLSSPSTVAPLAGTRSTNLADTYATHIGQIGVERVSSPVLTISAGGQAETTVGIRSGVLTDMLSLKSDISIVEPNFIRESPYIARSKLNKLSGPPYWPVRDIRVTYFDDELLILRDTHGVCDVLWRVGQSPNPEGQARVSHQQAVGFGVPQFDANAAHDVGDAETPTVEQLLEEVTALQESLQARRAGAMDDRSERARIIAELAKKERSLKAAIVESQASKANLQAVEQLKDRSSEMLAQQRGRYEEDDHLLQELETTVFALRSEAEVLQSRMAKAGTHEASLRDQIPVLEAEMRRSGRELRPAYRTAVAKVKEQLKAAGAERSNAKRSRQRLERELKKASARLERQREASAIQASLLTTIEGHLEGQHGESVDQRQHLSEAVAREEGLATEMEALQYQLSELETRQSETRELALKVEFAVDEISRQAKKAREVARTLKKSGGGRPWPFR